jgi:hypothetical protein
MPNVPTNKKLYMKVKSQTKRKFKVWPSAYASGWLVRTYKKLGGKYITSPSGKSKSVRKSRKRRSKNIMRFSPKRKSVRKSSRRKSVRKSSRRKSIRRSRKSKSVRKSRKRRSKTIMRFSPKRKSRKRSNKKSRKSKNTGLSRWFAEEWIDVCKLPRIVPCGRKSASKSKRSYPYCRPRYKITSKSPRSARSLSSYEIKKRCQKKRKSPHKRVLE